VRRGAEHSRPGKGRAVCAAARSRAGPEISTESVDNYVESLGGNVAERGWLVLCVNLPKF